MSLSLALAVAWARAVRVTLVLVRILLVVNHPAASNNDSTVSVEAKAARMTRVVPAIAIGLRTQLPTRRAGQDSGRGLGDCFEDIYVHLHRSGREADTN